ncbi:hypothetical protein [Streptomyces tendae]
MPEPVGTPVSDAVSPDPAATKGRRSPGLWEEGPDVGWQVRVAGGIVDR